MSHPFFAIGLMKNVTDYEANIYRQLALGAAVTLLATAGYVAPFFVTFPLAAPIQIIALGVLTAVNFGVITSKLYAHTYLPFYTYHHRQLPEVGKLVKDNTTYNAVLWGIHQSWKAGLVSGVLMACACRATKLAALSAVSLTPVAIAIVGYSCFQVYQTVKTFDFRYQLPANHRNYDNYIAELQNRNCSMRELGDVSLKEIAPTQADQVACMKVIAGHQMGAWTMNQSSQYLLIGSIVLRILLTI